MALSPDELKDITRVLREVFPHGHPDFLPTTLKEMQLHSDKNHDYAAGGSPMGNFERVAKVFALYPHLRLSDPRVVALAYAMKQLDATLWLLNSGHTAKVEGIDERMGDVSVYSKIVMCLNRDHAIRIRDEQEKAAIYEQQQRQAKVERPAQEYGATSSSYPALKRATPSPGLMVPPEASPVTDRATYAKGTRAPGEWPLNPGGCAGEGYGHGV